MKTHRILPVLIAVVILGVAPAVEARAEVRSLEERVTQVEREMKRMDAIVSLGVIAGAVCALWAQNTGRNAWLWFFAGLVFSVISLAVMLYKNAEGIRVRPSAARPPPGI